MQSVYLIRSETNGLWDYFKIGIAADVESRLAQLQTGNPYCLSIESCWQFDNAQAVETVLHQKYGKERIRGEWFKFIPSQVEEFDNLCNALGGLRQVPNEETASIDDVEEAEELSQPTASGKWDYAAMFADGWRMERQTNGRHVGEGCRYWAWRRGSKNPKEYIYGGVLADLPYQIEKMRQVFDVKDSGN